MNIAILRRLIATAIIVVGVCAGGYSIVVLPMKRELARAESEADSASAAIERMSRLQATLPELIGRRDLAKHRVSLVRAASRVARDEGVLYADVSALAADLGLRVTRLAPVGSGQSGENGPQSVRWSMEVVGSYGALTLFIKRFEERLGFAIVRSVVVTPDQTRVDTVVASIETEHFVIEPPEELSDAQ